MEWVDRPWTVESPDQLDTRWRAALRQYGLELPPGKTFLYVPPWKRDRRHKNEERSWLLFDSEDRMMIFESPPDGSMVYHSYPYRNVILVEEGEALLLAWVCLLGNRGGDRTKVRIEFHSCALPKLRTYLNRTLRVWGIASGSEEGTEDPLFHPAQRDRHFYRRLLDLHLGPNESVESLIYQPRVTSLRGFLRKHVHTLTPQQMAVQTPFRWILVEDTDGVRNLEYGTRVVSLARAHWEMKAMDDDCLIWRPSGESPGEKIEMNYPKRASQFARGGVDPVPHEPAVH